MNSVIIDSIYKLCSFLLGIIEKSRVYAIFMSVYGVIAGWWEKSAIIGFLKRGLGESKSAVFKLTRSPFTFLEFVNSKCSAFFRKNIRNSAAVKVCEGVLSGVFNLNTRFFGLFLITSGIICAVESVFDAGGIVAETKACAIVAVVGILLSIKSINIMKYIEESYFFGGVKTIVKALHSDSFNAGYPTLAAITLGIIAGIAGAYNILFLPVAAVGVFALIWILKVPFAGVVLAVFAAPLAPTMAVAGLSIYTTVAFFVKSLVTENFKFKFTKTACGVILFILILFLASLFSCSMISSLTVWAMYFVFGVFFFTVLGTVKSEDDVKTLFVSFSLAALAVAAYGIMQYLFGWTTENAWIDETMFAGETMRVYSTLGNPNVLGEYLLLALPVCAVLMLTIDRKQLSKWFFAVIFAVLAVCLILTQSRGCWLGFILGAVIFISFWNGKLWGLALLALCVLPWIVPESIVSRIASIGNMGDSSTSYRVFIWLGTLDMLKKYWVGGIGMGEGAFDIVYPKYSYNAIVAPHSHNVYLQLVVEGGIGTLIIFVGMLFVLFRELYSVYKFYGKNSFQKLAALGLGAGLAAFLLQSMFDYTFYNYRVMGIFFMYLGIGSALYMIKEKNK